MENSKCPYHVQLGEDVKIIRGERNPNITTDTFANALSALVTVLTRDFCYTPTVLSHEVPPLDFYEFAAVLFSDYIEKLRGHIRNIHLREMSVENPDYRAMLKVLSPDDPDNITPVLQGAGSGVSVLLSVIYELILKYNELKTRNYLKFQKSLDIENLWPIMVALSSVTLGGISQIETKLRENSNDFELVDFDDHYRLSFTREGVDTISTATKNRTHTTLNIHEVCPALRARVTVKEGKPISFTKEMVQTLLDIVKEYFFPPITQI